MRHALFFAPVFASALALTGCGGGEPAGGGTAAEQGAPGGGLPSSGWNVADACSVLAKADVAAVMGETVAGTELGTVSKGTDQLAGFSTCHYLMPDAMRQVGFMARLSPEPDNTPDAIRKARDEVAEFMGPVSDEAGLGRAAFWVPKLRQMVVFIGDDRYANITMPAGDDAAMRAKARTLLEKVI